MQLLFPQISFVFERLSGFDKHFFNCVQPKTSTFGRTYMRLSKGKWDFLDQRQNE